MGGNIHIDPINTEFINTTVMTVNRYTKLIKTLKGSAWVECIH